MTGLTTFALGIRTHLKAHHLPAHVHNVPLHSQFMVSIAGREPAAPPAPRLVTADRASVGGVVGVFELDWASMFTAAVVRAIVDRLAGGNHLHACLALSPQYAGGAPLPQTRLLALAYLFAMMILGTQMKFCHVAVVRRGAEVTAFDGLRRKPARNTAA